MKSVVERFLDYVRVDTQSLPGKSYVPSTEKQKDLSQILAAELTAIGASSVKTDEYGHVYASIPASQGYESAPKIGYIAHVDTSSAESGANVSPQITKNYAGGDILLNPEKGIILSVEDFPFLKNYIGQDIITSDGTTLLGADDKAGIAEIMSAAERMLSDPSIPHGEIKIAFTPDEEVGHGVVKFDLDAFGADFAYTVDGGALGELTYETFNAAALHLTVYGRSIHPGRAKSQMKNALMLLMEFESMLPPQERPEFTDGYEGYFHMDEMSGSVAQATADFLIRDHNREKFEARKNYIRNICRYLNQKYGGEVFVPGITDTYYNMKDKILPNASHLIETAKSAMEELGMVPDSPPFRGGTDGAVLSYLGLPCPNLCTGGHNFHGRFEFISAQAMERVVELLIAIAKRYSQK